MIIKKFLKLTWDEFIYGGHLLSLGGSGIIASVLILLNHKIDWQILVIAYLLSQITYTYNHFKEAKEDLLTNPERANHLQGAVKYFPLLIFLYSFFLLFLLVLFTNLNTLLFVIFLAFAGVLYPKKLTQKIIGFKNIYVAFLWAIGVFLPFFYYSFHFSLFFILIFLFVLLRWIINTTFFDIKDIEGDKIEKIKTLPVVLGKEGTLKYLSLVNFFSFFPLMLAVYLQIFPIFTLSLIFFSLYTFYYLQKTKTIDSKSIRSLSYIMVDGEYILWPLVLIVSKTLIT